MKPLIVVNTIVTCLVAVASLADSQTGAPLQSPNILYIFTDQQSADALSCAGNQFVHTPALDGLAARGVRLTESYCASPVCSPSRGSMLTGLFPHQHGVTVNDRRIKPELQEICIEHLLGAQGYDCVYAGKWHLAAGAIASPEEQKQHPYRIISRMSDTGVTKASAKFLAEKHDRPFFLIASYLNPHDICLWGMGRTKGYQEPQVPEVPPDECPPLPDNFAVPGGEPSVLRDFYLTRHTEHAAFDEAKWRQYRHAYFQMVEAVDAEIGQVLDALSENGLERNTLVIFSSDHGEGMGSHQWLSKCCHYEEATRVPFIVSFPGVIGPGRVDRTHLVSSGPDFYATALDYAGVAIPDGCQGRSLRPLLEDRQSTVAWRDQVVSEIWVPGNSPRKGEAWRSAWGRMLRTERFKYSVYDRGSHREQLYDMQQDRGEMHNLAEDPAYHEVLQEHRRRLAEWCEQTHDTGFARFIPQ